ncbi:MAG: hypothetical protein DMG76_35475 [Acidobacteria bacterium]|nr:MAG: hypothetical protein DMG76_35475 [Acidobacteriota bacterium]
MKSPLQPTYKQGTAKSGCATKDKMPGFPTLINIVGPPQTGGKPGATNANSRTQASTQPRVAVPREPKKGTMYRAPTKRAEKAAHKSGESHGKTRK